MNNGSLNELFDYIHDNLRAAGPSQASSVLQQCLTVLGRIQKLAIADAAMNLEFENCASVVTRYFRALEDDPENLSLINSKKKAERVVFALESAVTISQPNGGERNEAI